MPDPSTPANDASLRASWAREVRTRLSSLRLAPTREAEIVDELSQHLDDRYRELIAGGASADEAARLTLAEFQSGNVLAQYMAPLRQSNSPPVIAPGAATGHVLTDLWQDLRYAARMFRKQPGFAATVLLTLALGIGATTAIFSTVDAVLLRGLPYEDPDRLVMVWEHAPTAGFPKNTPAPANYVDWNSRNQVFTEMAATISRTANLTDREPPEQVLGRGVTANFFSVLGVRPVLGRVFTEEEDRTEAPIVMLSHQLWRRRYQGDPAILGQTIVMSGMRHAVVGVMPADFVFRNREIEYWVPIGSTPKFQGVRSVHSLNVVARLKPGVTVERAASEMNAIATELARQYPENANIGVVVVPIDEELLGDTSIMLLVLVIAAGSVMLIACANLASLLLARAVSRQHEFSMRLALGADRRRLIRQMITESMILSLVGGALGVWVALASIRALSPLVPLSVVAAGTPNVDSRLLAIAFVLSVLTGLAFSIIPAVRAAAASPNDALKQSSRSAVSGRNRAREILITIEMAAALVLLVSAGLMLQTLASLRAVDIGFRPQHLLTVRTSLPADKYREPARRIAFYDSVLAGVRALPGVENAAYASTLPFTSQGNTAGYRIENRTLEQGDPGDALFRVMTNDYLDTLGVRLLEGRLPQATDGPDSAPVVVVNAAFARRYWPNGTALGYRIAVTLKEPVWMTIIGVVADVRERGYDVEMKPGMYVLASQLGLSANTLIIRSVHDPLTVLPAIRRVVASVDPEQPIAAVQTMDEILGSGLADRRQVMVLLSAFAALGLILASLGIYALLSHTVSQRSREVALRIAFGASRGAVVRKVVGRGLVLTAIGLTIGLAGCWAVTSMMRTLLHGVQPNDPMTLAAVTTLLMIVALAACWMPARRASRLDPAVILREG